MPKLTKAHLLKLQESIRVHARLRLEALLHSDPTLNNLTQDILRPELIDSIKAAIMDNLSIICRGAKSITRDGFHIHQNQPFQVGLGLNHRCPDELDITFYAANQRAEKITDSLLPLRTEVGSYEKLAVHSNNGIKLNSQALTMIVECVIDTSYTWTASRLHEILQGPHAPLANRLYQRIYEIQSPEVANQVWLGFVRNGRCYYLVDSHRCQPLLLQISQVSRAIRAEPLALLKDLFGMELPFEESVANAALSRNEPLKYNIGELPYSATRPTLIAAKQALYKAEEISVIPICHLERSESFLVAYTSAAYSDYWVGFFERHREDLTTILKDTFPSLFNRVLQTTKTTLLDSAGALSESGRSVAEFTGITIGAALDHIQKHFGR